MACALSVALHVAVLFLMATLTFTTPLLRTTVSPERLERTMQMREVSPEQTPAAESWIEAARAADGGPSIDPAAEADALGRGVDEVTIDPPPLEDERLVGEDASLVEPGSVPERDAWQPRQDILMVENPVVVDRVSAIPRRRIPRIDRVRRAEDVVVPFDAVDAARSVGAAVREPAVAEPPAGREIDARVEGEDGEQADTGLTIGEPDAETGADVFEDRVKQAAEIMPIESLLTARVTTFTPATDFRYGYFRIEIERSGEELLPTIPKDIVLVQDCSASMTEQKLHFCREGLRRCLEGIGSQDLFNVIKFHDRARMCFDDWSDPAVASLEQAREFVGSMQSAGNTDIYKSISELVKIRRTPGRPLIALLVSDGRSTSGLTDSTDIIGEFSKLNSGAVSVYTVGTAQTADSYLLDLLSYCNGGTSFVVSKGRWAIPESMERIMREISRPVLGNVRVRFARAAECDAYPQLTGNLFMDRPLVLYGRYPKGLKNVVFRAVGQAAEVKCDMIFNLSLEVGTERGDKDVRTAWARQRIYHLIGQYARRPSPELLKQITSTARTYRVRVPYSGRL